MSEPQALNVLGDPLEPCGTEPMTGWYRDGCCNTDPSDVGSHTICASVSQEFLEHQAAIGNNLMTPMPQFGFPGLKPGDRWCVTAANWLRAHMDGAAAPVVLASTHERAIDIVPLDILKLYAVDVPADLTELETLDEPTDTGDPDTGQPDEPGESDGPDSGQPDGSDPDSPDAEGS